MLSQNQILSSLKAYKDKYTKEYGIEEIGIFGVHTDIVQLRLKRVW